MYLKFVCSILLIAVLARAQSASIESKIVGGSDVSDGAYPFMVSLQSPWDTDGTDEHFCGAIVISPEYAITTVTCVNGFSGSGNKITLVAGTSRLSSSSASLHELTNIVMHENFEVENAHLNDIAIVTVSPSFTFGPFLGAAKLPEQGVDAPQQGLPAILLGWGNNETMTYNHDILQEVWVEIRDREWCSSVYYEEFFYPVHPEQICADKPEGGGGACFYDKGGPLIADGVVIGLASWWHSCAIPGFPTVFTRVSEYRDWIRDHTGI